MPINKLDYPAIDGRVVTQGHADYCTNNGHAAYVENGKDMGYCPRCGTSTTRENETMTEAEFKKALSTMTNDERHRCRELAKGLKDSGWTWERARAYAVAQIWGM